MEKVNSKLIKYINQLPFMGLGYLFVGIAGVALGYKATLHDPSINAIFIVMGIILGYLTVVYADPGGSVTLYYFTNRSKTPDEEKLYLLVKKYKSKLLLILITLILILSFSLKAFFNSEIPNILTINNIIWLLVWNTLTMLMLGNGIKYLSAWMNIKRNLKNLDL